VVDADDEGRAIALVNALSRTDFPRTGVRVAEDGTIARPAEVLDGAGRLRVRKDPPARRDSTIRRDSTARPPARPPR
jgi:hypothetical protein